MIEHGIDTNKVNPAPWFLMLSYLYYEHNITLFSDAWFDELCVRMLVDSEWRTEHEHSDLITDDMLVAGTGHTLMGKFPTRVQGAALRLIDDLASGVTL